MESTKGVDVMSKETAKYESNSLVVDNDIEKVNDLENDQGFVFRMNINNSVSSHLRSSLENIYNTIKDRPDIELKQHDEHTYGSYPPVENETFSFKEEVLWSLKIMREFEDVMLDKSMEEYKKRKSK